MFQDEISQAAGAYARDFLQGQFRAVGEGAGGAEAAVEQAAHASGESRDVLVAFALFLQNYLRTPAAERSAGAGAPAAAAPACPVDHSLEADLPARLVEALMDPAMAGLRGLLARSAAGPAAKEAWTLLCLLRVYFEMDWRDAKEILQELAYRAGEALCLVAKSQSDPAEALAMGCRLLNAQPQFREHYECRALPPRCGFDSRYCETPAGPPRDGNTVLPTSLYIVNNRSGQLCRRARTVWA
jgi:hypothetical protein